MKDYYKTSNTITINHKTTNKKTYPVYKTSKGGFFIFSKTRIMRNKKGI